MKIYKHKIIILFFLISFTLAASSFAIPPKTLNYSGKLSRATGTPVSEPMIMNFIIYPSAGYGVEEWHEEQLVTPDASGVFKVVLGKSTPMTGVDFSHQLYLAVETPPGSGNELVPRKQLTASPYAHFSASAETVSTAEYALNVGHAVSADSAASSPNGALVPPGTVIAFAGETTPEGYLLCDGTQYHGTTQYPLLYAAIGTMYGGTSPWFKVPDYRGYFLRCWDNGASNDPDHTTLRTNRGDGISGNFVGTKQDYKMRSHNHVIYVSGNNNENLVTSDPIRGQTDYWVNQNTVCVLKLGGLESRPKNKYVMYIIRAK